MSSQCNPHSPCKIFFLGHSFVRRLEDFMVENGKRNFLLPLEGYDIKFKARGGMKACHLNLRMNLKLVSRHKPDIVFIDVGTNDLDSCLQHPKPLANQVLSSCTYLVKSHSVKHVVILHVLPRTYKGKYPCNNPLFNHQANEYNQAIMAGIKTSTPHGQRRIHFWCHKGLSHNPTQYIEDGVHLNNQGMIKYYKSLRRAIIKFTTLSHVKP